MCWLISGSIPQELETVGRHGNVVRATQSEISSQLREKKNERFHKSRQEGGRRHFLSVSRPACFLFLPFFFFFEIRRKRKTQAGKQWRQKHVSVSRGTEVDKARLWEGEVGFGN